jgi:elongation of very long chain fatty acids protein 6
MKFTLKYISLTKKYTNKMFSKPLDSFKLYPKNYYYKTTVNIFEEYEWVWTYSFLFYLPLCQIFLGFHNPKHKNTYKIIGFVWNVLLSLFSLVGTYFTVPYIVNCLKRDGLDSLLQLDNPTCDYRYIPSVSFWSTLFVISKIPELFDTYLYILKNGKQHIFLHWYHHLFTGVYAYFLVRKEEFRLGIWMTALNFFVHTFMYGYYAVMEITDRNSMLRKFVMGNSSFITFIQILQMCIILTLFMYDWLKLGNQLDHFGFAMYLVYAVLFGKLFLEKYCLRKKKD